MSRTFRMFAWSHRRIAVWAAIALAYGLTSGNAAAQGNAVSADEVKAAFLFNFGSYVEWPPEALAGGELIIGVIGGDQIARELRELLPGRTIENRPVQVRVLTPASSLQNVHILYIGGAPHEDVAELIGAVSDRPVLVITDAPDGMQRGSMINFVLEGRRVRFEISRGAAERARLKLSSRLLSVALRVHSSGLPRHVAPASPVLAQLTRD